MQIEEYFDFLEPDDIRVKGTRIGVESILYEYVHRGRSAEEIADRFVTVTLEQVYATILYYLRHREQMDGYLAEWIAFGREAREAQRRAPSAALEKLRRLKAAQRSVSTSS